VSAPRKLCRQRRLTLLLVLPALLLRALIPTGFMPLAGAGGAYLGLCPGAVPANATIEVLGHHTHQHHTHDQGGAPSTQHHAACIFSLGATTASATAAPTESAIAPTIGPAANAGSLVLLPSILRAQSSRGPPPAV
jgi:predicted DNA repair protein MutK